jgi:hypothetical protein
MKDNSISPVVTKVGSFSESKFGIASSEDLVYIFDILRNKLYSDKVLAVVREYCTNAADANTENGLSNEPIVITVPNKMNPVFKVRDYGKGLSEEDVRSIYCMYGRSTKRNSNAFTGQLGLGSKSGFAYGDTFTITSFCDGLKTVYSAYIDESRLGSIAKISETHTSADPGIEICIPVKSNDVDVFSKKIAHVIRFFRVKPVVIGNIEETHRKIAFSGNGWRVLDPSSSYYNYSSSNGYKNAVAVMGNIGYPIDTSLVFPEIKDYWAKDMSKEYKFVSGLVEIEFDIGELSIAASREELEYNSVTVKAIKDKAKKYFDELINKINSEVSLAEDGIKARIATSKIDGFTRAGNWGEIRNSISWRGKKNLNHFMQTDFTGLAVDEFVHTGHKTHRSTNVANIRITEDCLKQDCFWLVDDSKNCILKMSDMAKKNPGKTFYLFRLTETKTADGQTVDGSEFFDKNDFPKSYLKLISTYELKREKVERKQAQRASRGSIPVFTLSNKVTNWGVQRNNWESCSIPASQEFVYIEINKFKPFINGHERNIDNIAKLRTSLKYFGIKMPDFYGIKVSDVEKAKNGISITQWLNNEVVTHPKVSADISRIFGRYSIIDCNAWSVCPLLSSCIDEIDVNKIPSGTFEKFIRKIKTLNIPVSSEFSHIECISDFAKIDRDKINKTHRDDFDKIISEFRSKYPLLQYLSAASKSERTQAVVSMIDYVNKIEN